MRLVDSGFFDRPWSEERGEWEDTRHFLPDIPPDPILLIRGDDGTPSASIPQEWHVHSPTGFEWGYGGSGPADLALNILGLYVPPAEAWRLHQRFKTEVIARLPRDGGVLQSPRIVAWIEKEWRTGQNE